MGLFKHNNKDKTNTTSIRDADTSQRSQMAPATTGVGLGGPGPATSGPAADHQLRDQNIGGTSANPNISNTAPEANTAGRGAHHRLGDDRRIDPALSGGGAQGQQFDNDNTRDRMGMGRNYTNGGHYPAEHQHHHHRQQNQNEAALGSGEAGSGVIGSGAIAEARLAKERELKAIDSQSQELAQAERLEQEAKIHRQRAVELGAHPDNRHLGGVVP